MPLQLGQRTPYGTWEACELRLELEQLGGGELVGIGAISTPGGPSPVPSEVIVSGVLHEDGTATLEIDPVTDAGHGSMTLRVRVVVDPGTQDPSVTEVLEVTGRRRGRPANGHAMPAR